VGRVVGSRFSKSSQKLSHDQGCHRLSGDTCNISGKEQRLRSHISTVVFFASFFTAVGVISPFALSRAVMMTLAAPRSTRVVEVTRPRPVLEPVTSYVVPLTCSDVMVSET